MKRRNAYLEDIAITGRKRRSAMGETMRGSRLSGHGFIDGAQGVSTRIAWLAYTAETRETLRLGQGAERRARSRPGQLNKFRGGTWPSGCHRAPS